MKRFFIFLIVVIIFGLIIWGLNQAQPDAGYVLITHGAWTIETTFWFAILGLFIFIILAALIWKLLSLLFRAPQNMRAWKTRRHLKQARDNTLKGFVCLAEGELKKAEKLLTQNANHYPIDFLNYIGAAIAVPEKQDDYLKQAQEVYPEASLAVGIIRAQLQFRQQDFSSCVNTLKQLHQQAPKQALILRLLMQSYQKLEQHEALLETWRSLPNSYHHELWAIRLIVPTLLQFNDQHRLAEKLIREAIDKKWDEALVAYYGDLHLENSSKLLNTTEHWLKQHPHNAVLMLTIGKICMHAKMRGKAQQYLEKSLEIKPTAAACLYLARLHEEAGELDKSQGYYKQGLKIDWK